MPLLIDRRPANSAPGLHALIIGVSKYDYLPDVDDPPKKETWDLKSLGAPALSAALICKWIKDQDEIGGLATQLKTLRLLVSPTKVEEAGLPDWVRTTDAPNHANVLEAVRSWHADSQDSQNSIAFFYYSGHGFARGRGESGAVLTMSDLFDPRAPKHTRTVPASNLLNGMAPQTTSDTVARQQIFFFDCCRTFPDAIKAIDDRSISPMLDVFANEGVPDDRVIARSYAVPDNSAAFASVGKATYFGTALLDALNRAGRSVSGRGWQLDGEAIHLRLKARYDREAQRRADCNDVGGGPLLCHLRSPPLVDLDVELKPPPDPRGRTIALIRGGVGPISGVEATAGCHKIEVPPGEYELNLAGANGKWTGTHDRRIVLPNFFNPWVAEGWG
jgi:hypothetical protein